MKKFKIASLLLTLMMLLQVFSAVTVNAAPLLATTLSINEDLPEGNLLKFSRFSSDNSLLYWVKDGSFKFDFVKDDNGGYLRVTNIDQSHFGPVYTPGEAIKAGKYLFTGYFRTLREGQFTELRIFFNMKNGSRKIAYAYPTNDWLKVNFYLDLEDDLSTIKVCGGSPAIMTQDYCFDHFSLVPVDTIPENAPSSFGTKVTEAQVKEMLGNTVDTWAWDPKEEEQYEVNGIILNHDFSDYMVGAGRNEISENDIIKFVKQYEGTHITDYFISVNDVVASFPTNGGTQSYIDKYYQKEENGIPVDYASGDYSVGPQAKGAYYLYETLGVDPIGMFIETLEEININPWLSFRMNDAHDQSSKQTSVLFSDFYHNHPEIRRVQHHDYITYFDRAMDYSYPLVREYMLKFINDALNRYDTYGIELDFQREIYLWHIGGEYNGLDILNEFMRQVDDLVMIYEEKYGHKIQIAASVAYDIDTNYGFGLDVITWMAEGLVDMIVPSCRWSITNLDIPIKQWDSLTEAHGVTLAARIEPSVSVSPVTAAIGMDYDTACAAAANYFSQGAEKIYLFNWYRNAVSIFNSTDKLMTKDYKKATQWTTLCTIGSYEKLMYMNRRCLITWVDITPLWEPIVQYLPATVGNVEYKTLRIPVGDVLVGSKLTLKFSVSNKETINNPPAVFVNSALCEYKGIDLCRDAQTEEILMCYEIPESVHGDTYMVVEMRAMTEKGFTTDYVEVYVEGPDLN